MAAENLVIGNQQNFDQEVLKNNKPVLVDFWAEWCGPCKALAPVLEEVAKDLNGRGHIVKINVDDNRELAQKYGIRSIPTLIFFKDGAIKKTLIGNQQKNEITKSFNELT